MRSISDLPKLKPVEFPRNKGAGKIAYKIKGTKGQPTRKVIAEMRKLSKQDIYPAQ